MHYWKVKKNNNTDKQGLIDIWNNSYTYLIPTAIIIIVLSLDDIVKIIVVSKALKDVLDSIITFISIGVGLIGVLLTLLITLKKDSKIIIYFFKKANMKSFRRCIKYNICSGFTTIILSSLMYLSQLDNCITSINNFQKFILFIFYIWIWFLFSYLCSTYRFINIILLLFTEEENDVKRETYNISKEEKEEINKLLEKSISKK